MQAAIAVETRETSLLKRALFIFDPDGSGRPAESSAHRRFRLSRAETISDLGTSDSNQLVQRFDDVTWQTFVPIALLVLTLMLGTLVCAQALLSVG